MTREEKIKGLYSLKEYLVENPIELEGHKSLPITLIDYAIESLEQEPILDKIRAEMFEEMVSHSGTGEEVIQAYADGLKKGLNILDKYKAESEPQESEEAAAAEEED